MAKSKDTLSLDNPTITPNTAIDLIVALYLENPAKPLPAFLWGKMGIGKSESIQAAGQKLAEHFGLEFCYQPTRDQLHSPEFCARHFMVVDKRMAQENPVDVKGLPAREKISHTHVVEIDGVATEVTETHDLMIWLRPEQMPVGGRGIFLLDEFPQAQKAVQAACYQLILDRAAGTHKIPDGWHMIAGGNRVSDKGVFYEMPAALANRFLHFEVEENLDEWIEWAVKHNIRTEVLMFLQFKTNLLHAFDPAREQIRAFPTPRSWSYVSRLLALPPAVRRHAIAGAIGPGAFTEFQAFLNVWEKLPNIEAILAGKDKTIPKEHDVLFAVVGSLVDRLTTKNRDHFMNYVALLPAEFTVLGIRFAMRTGKKFINESPSFKTWIMANQKLIM